MALRSVSDGVFWWRKGYGAAAKVAFFVAWIQLIHGRFPSHDEYQRME
jgi:hypothetical protein